MCVYACANERGVWCAVVCVSLSLCVCVCVCVCLSVCVCLYVFDLHTFVWGFPH